MSVGYTRADRLEPGDVVREETALRLAGCEAVFVEDGGGEGAGAERAAWKAALDKLHVGDTLIVRRFELLGRNWGELVDCLENLARKKVHFVSLDDGIDTRLPGGDVVFTVFTALKDFGRSLTVVRARGRSGGRKSLAPEKVAELKRLARDASVRPAEICRTLGISRATYYRYMGK